MTECGSVFVEPASGKASVNGCGEEFVSRSAFGFTFTLSLSGDQPRAEEGHGRKVVRMPLFSWIKSEKRHDRASVFRERVIQIPFPAFHGRI